MAETRTGELDAFNVQNGAGIIVNNFFDIDQPDRGIAIFGNQMIGNTVRANDGPGIATASNINGRIIGNVVQNNGHSPNNLAPGNGIGVQRSAFILIQNFNVLVQDNISTGNGRDGVRIDFGPVGNRIVNNRATGNGVPFRTVQGFDLNDMNRGCGPLPPNPALNNVWDRNTYTTFSQPCVTAGGTFVPATSAAASAAAAAERRPTSVDELPPRRR